MWWMWNSFATLPWIITINEMKVIFLKIYRQTKASFVQLCCSCGCSTLQWGAGRWNMIRRKDDSLRFHLHPCTCGKVHGRTQIWNFLTVSRLTSSYYELCVEVSFLTVSTWWRCYPIYKQQSAPPTGDKNLGHHLETSENRRLDCYF